MAKLKIYNEVKDLLGNYETRPVEIIPGLYFNQYKTIKMCEFYANSKYLGGKTDELQGGYFERDKPFYNIVNFRVTLAKVATQLDIKDVQITSDNPSHYIHSMLLQKEAYEWMKVTNFENFLNEMGQTRAKYGGVLVKRTFVKNDDGEEELVIEVEDWRNTATDQVKVLDGAIIVTHYMTPSQLMAKDGVWDNVREFIQANEKAMTKASKYDQKHEQHNTDRAIVYEVTGEFARAFLKDFHNEELEDDDEYNYENMHYFIGDVNGKPYPLFGEIQSKKDFQYKYLDWEKMPGRALGRGVIEDAEEAQVWTNDSVINEKNAMDLAGKVVIKTTSKTAGANILEVDNGRIFELEQGEEFDSVSLEPSAIGEFENQITRWKAQADDATGSYDANTGKQPPANTPFAQTEMLNQVGDKPLDYRRGEAGKFLTEIFDDWVVPFLVKKLYAGHLLPTDFTQEELEVIDQTFATWSVNQKAIEAILSGKILTAGAYQTAIATYRANLKGSRRFLEIPEGFFKDVEAQVTVITTGEQKNKAAILQSLSTILADVQQTYNPQTGTFAVLENPVMARIFGTILELSGAGISPVSLGIGMQSPTQGAGTPSVQAAPQQAAAPSPQAPIPSPIQAQPVPTQ
jgi:hypothetical protein